MDRPTMQEMLDWKRDAERQIAAAGKASGRGESDIRILRLIALIHEYENSITWDTTCLNCSALMDKNYEQYVRLDKVKAALADKFYIPSQYEEDALLYAEPVRAALEDDLG